MLKKSISKVSAECVSKQWLVWNENYTVHLHRSASNHERTARNTGLGLKWHWSPCKAFLTTQSLETHLEAKRATKYHKMCLSAKNRIKRIAEQETNCYHPERPRVIQSVFLSKYRLLIALDTVFRRKRDWLPRDWFLSPNLPETHFKVKSHHSIFQSTSFNRKLRRMRSTNNIFPSRIKYQSNSFIHKRLRTPRDLLSSPNFPESRLKWKRIQGTSECSSFSRGLRETSFGGCVFIHPPRTRLHTEID